MLTGAHILLFSDNPEADRAFFRDVLRFPSVDAGRGWLIFALPSSELALHPADENGEQEPGERKELEASFYLMCDDLKAQIKSLDAKAVRCTAVTEEPWGSRTSIVLPSGGEIGLYQPRHPTALDLAAART